MVSTAYSSSSHQRRARHQFPARRRLHAAREAALRDLVPLRADLLHDLAVEQRVGFLRAEEALVHLVAEVGRAGRVVERADLRVEVELHLLGRDARLRRRVDHVAGRHHQARLRVVVDLVGEELLRARVVGHLHFADEAVLRTVDLDPQLARELEAGHLLRQHDGRQRGQDEQEREHTECQNRLHGLGREVERGGDPQNITRDRARRRRRRAMRGPHPRGTASPRRPRVHCLRTRPSSRRPVSAPTRPGRPGRGP